MGRLRGGKQSVARLLYPWAVCLSISVVYHFYPLYKQRNYIIFGNGELDDSVFSSDNQDKDKEKDTRFDYRPPTQN